MRHLSVFERDGDILRAFDDIYLKNSWYDLDCTYGKGSFYKSVRQPRMKSDIRPLYDDVACADSRKLEQAADGTLASIVFDPPFLFRKRKAENRDWMSGWYSSFGSYEELREMYVSSLMCFWRKLKNGGYVFFKCQDMTDGRFYDTHVMVIEAARSMGFVLKDIGVKCGKRKFQRDARQQNCLAKVHSYWLVLQKKDKG